MNKLKIIYLLVLLGSISACRDFVEPAIPYTDFERGTYLRTITPPATINFFALTTEQFSILVESVDENDGSSVESVEVFVARRRANTVTAEQSVATIQKSAFTKTGDSKYLRATITVPVSAALTALGLTAGDINGGDFFEFRLALTDNEGLVFSNNNVSGDVAGGTYYASPFFYRVAVVCPSDLGGTYSYVTSMIECDNCPGSVPGPAGCGSSISGTGTFAATTTAGRYAVSDATFGQYGCAWNDNPATGVFFVDACGNVSTAGSDQYGLIYTFTIIANTGTALTIDWENDYGDSGRTVLTRTDSKTWPAGLTTN